MGAANTAATNSQLNFLQREDKRTHSNFMAKSLSFTGFVLKNLRRRRLRTLLTLAGIGMAVGAFVGLVGFSSAFEQQWLRIYSSSGTDIAVIQGTFLNTSLDESTTAKLRDLPDVAQASPTIFNLMDLTPDVNALVYGWKDDAFQFGSLQILAGRRFRDGRAEVILGDMLAQDLKKAPGDILEIQGTPFTVTAIYHGASTLEAAAVVMPLDQLQQLSSLQGKVSTIDVRLRPAPRGETPEQYLKHAQAEIEAALPGMRAVPAAERASDNQFVKLAHASAWGTSSLALLIGILGIANTMAMSVFERTREIGILRALGWNRWQVLAHIEIEAVTLGLGGGFLGIALGWCALQVLAALPRTASLVSASLHWQLLAEAVGIAVFAGLIAGALPALRAGQLSPVDALRHD
ncbi:ABC transporter permease [Edaphobacter aggregans]|uniref:ABC transporter permease n=1 Tax=Edaphobacter aggregans TaxID=570835 RepID=UPI0005596122|nr:ABC transporter permease [Edaphobacter aggregans]